MLSNVSSSVFLNAESITMLPAVTAEWNHNLYSPPYVVVSGDGTATQLSGAGLSDVSTSSIYYKENFTTKSFTITDTTTTTKTFTFGSTLGADKAYKFIFYAKTDSSYPVVLNASISGNASPTEAKAAKSYEIDNIVWTKYEIYVGWSSLTSETSLTLSLYASSLGAGGTKNVYITLPEVYSITKFDYEHGSLWSAYSPFKFFRPGESLVPCGNPGVDYPTNFRRATKGLKTGQAYQDMPVSPVVYNPAFLLSYPPVGIYKTGLASDINSYQYFLSSKTSGEKTISAKYEKALTSNKIVMKFNVIATTPTVEVFLDGISIGSFTPDVNGVLVLYYVDYTGTGGYWTDVRADSAVPVLSENTLIPYATSFQKITVTQTSATVNSEFSSFTSIASDLQRMHLIEISPRLEIDLSDFVESISINKSLDSATEYVPISSINSNDASISLSSIPFTAVDGTSIPTFSNETNATSNLFANMLKKNVKFYINYLVSDHSDDLLFSPTYVPAGVFYADSWSEDDVSSVTVQAYDATRYLQSTPVTDYVANTKKVFNIITNMLDLTGFTDYDYDSLYDVCNDQSLPVDLAYYYANSKETTLLDALSQIFLAYQIGAYIDEYGVMKFLSLNNLLTNVTPDISINDDNIVDGGYSFESSSKPGKISLRYQPPKIKQSLSLQNAKDVNFKNSPSFIFTTSNDVVWSQESQDSVGFNYLNSSFLATDNKLTLKQSDLLNIFHTYNLNNSGYAIVESEVVSFDNKEYKIYKYTNNTITETVSVKNDTELSSAISNFINKKSIGLLDNTATITGVSASGTQIVYTYSGTLNIKKNDRVSISGISPSQFNKVSAIVAEVGTGTFSINATDTGTYVSGGTAVGKIDYDIVISPTGNITGLRRGLFNTKINDHKLLSNSLLDDKKLGTFGTYTAIVGDPDTIGKNKIAVYGADSSTWTYHSNFVYPTNDKDFGNQSQTDTVSSISKYLGYQTYVTKFEFVESANEGLGESKVGVFGLFFNSSSAASNNNNTYFIEIRKDYIKRTGSGTTEDPYVYTYRYGCFVYKNISGANTLIAYSDITTLVNSIQNHFPKKLIENTTAGTISYVRDPMTTFPFILRAVHSPLLEHENLVDMSTTEVFENADRSLRVFLNGIEITAWQISNVDYTATSLSVTNATAPGIYTYGTATYTVNNDNGSGVKIINPGDYVYISGINPVAFNFSGTVTASTLTSISVTMFFSGSNTTYSSGGTVTLSDTDDGSINYFKPISKNSSGIRNPLAIVASELTANSFYGAYGGAAFSTIYDLPSVQTIFPSKQHDPESTGIIGYISEIYATQADLKEHGINYFYQDRRFLNRSIQSQNIFGKTYHMQTKPEVVGLNYYDVQYTNGGAMSVDVLPVEYLWNYFPGENINDQKWYQKHYVPDWAAAYSTPINTGFRARMLIANASPHLVYLTHESDQINQFTSHLNLWTHEIITSSEQEILEKTIDSGNSSEVAQIDSEWVQSRQAANKIVSSIGAGIDGFSKTTTINIFGNPLIQVGDVVSLTYSLNKINQQIYVVTAISHSYDGGLETTLTLKTIKKGV